MMVLHVRGLILMVLHVRRKTRLGRQGFSKRYRRKCLCRSLCNWPKLDVYVQMYVCVYRGLVFRV